MSVTFVIGRAGSGKTFHCRASIAAALRANPLGPPIYWLLPKQGTFTAERELTCGSGLEGYCRARVVSFDQFAQDIFNDCGGSAVPEVTGIGRQMILGHLLRRLAPQLTYFGSVARQVGLAAELDVTFAELERAGRTTTDLKTLRDELEQSGAGDIEAGSLAAKIHDLHLIYESYTRFLGNDRLDQHRRLTQVLEGIERCSFLSKATLFVDGFTRFTDFQRRVLAAAGRAGAAVKITLLMDPGSPTLSDPHTLPTETAFFHQTESTYRRLWFAFAEAGVPVNEPILLESGRRFTAPALAFLEREFVSPPERRGTAVPASPPRDSNSAISDLPSDWPPQAVNRAIRRIEAADRKSEVDAVAREIRGLLQRGMRLRDIAVLARDIGQYEVLIGASFGEHEIPYFVDRRRTAIHHPLPQFLRSALRIARFDWLDEAVMAFIKTGLAGVTLDEADELENYVLLHRVRGEGWETPQPWNFRRGMTLGGDDPLPASATPEPSRIDAIRRRVVDPLVPFVKSIREGHPLPVRRLATEIFALLEAFKVRQTLAQWMNEAATLPAAGAAAAIEERDEHEQVWSALVELFEQLVDLLGDELMSPTEFVEVLESGLERFDLALTPPTVDQVLVGQVDRTLCPPVRAVIVPGLNSGEFPAVAHDQTVLSDRERRELGRRKMELDPESRRRVLDEPLLGYQAFMQPSETLILTRSETDNRGRKTSPSAFWQRLGELFPGLPVTTIPASRADHPEQISTPRQLVTSVMAWVRNGSPEPAEADVGDHWPALYQWLATRAPHDDAIHHLRSRAWPALTYRNDAAISSQVNQSLFASPLVTTAAQLETFAACPFRHFVRYGLRLEVRPERDVTMRDLARVYRTVLEKLFKQVIHSPPTWDQDPLPITPRMIGEAVRSVGRALRGELMLSTARNKYLLYRVEQTLTQVIGSQRELMKRYRFRPSQVGVLFGHEETLAALSVQTPAGAKVLVEGSIDRVDSLIEGSDVVALDYRLAVGPLSLAKVYHGLSLQLLTSLLAIASADNELAHAPRRPVGGFFVQLLRSLGDVAHPDDAPPLTDPKYLLALKPRGVFDSRSLGNLDSELSEGRSIALAAYINKGGGLGYRASTDAAEADEFAALLSAAREHIGRIADQILGGSIGITPYRLNQESPCARCEYRGVCRFETSVNNYRHLGAMGRVQVLDTLRGAGNGE